MNCTSGILFFISSASNPGPVGQVDDVAIPIEAEMQLSDLINVLMKFILLKFVGYPQSDKQCTGKARGESENVNERIEPLANGMRGRRR